MQLALRILTVLAFSVGAAAGAAEREARFSAPEIEIITRYYHAVAAPTQQGGRGANRLPRGIAKNLARGKTLPPGLAKRALPNELVVQLPPPPVGYERLVVAGKILLIETATQVVHDVLTDVLFR
jgi:hypothetical protein